MRADPPPDRPASGTGAAAAGGTGLRRGPRNSIADVADIAVAHSEARLTAVLPCPLGVRRRKLWGAFRRQGQVGDITGLHVLGDFGTLSSPIVFCPLTWLGAVYDALIADALRRDVELSIDAGWPPVVVGISSPSDPDPRQPLPERAVELVLAAAGADFPAGPVGAGERWLSFGLPGGIGTASRLTRAGRRVGVLAATNGGRPGDLGPALPAVPHPAGGGADPGAFAIVVASDAPLGPRSAGLVAERALAGLAAAGALRSGAGAFVLALSTAQPIDEAFVDSARSVRRLEAPAAELETLCAAAAEAVPEAVLRAVLPEGPPAG